MWGGKGVRRLDLIVAYRRPTKDKRCVILADGGQGRDKSFVTVTVVRLIVSPRAIRTVYLYI